MVLIINNMQLELEEQIQVTDLMNNYRSIHNQICEVEDQLKQLTSRQQDLCQKLEQARALEREFGEQIKQKYGQGKLNALTLEYTVE
jgi:hypothetical protein